MFLTPSVLSIKMRRELWRMRGQALAIALVITGGVAVTVLSLVNYSSLLATRAAYYEDYQFADVFVSLTRAPRYLEKVIAGIPGVHSLAARVEASARLEVPGFGEPVSARVLSLPPAGQPQVNRLFLRQGRLPRPGHTDETVIIQGFAEAHNLLPGDTITAIVNGRQQTLRITGVAESPEFIYVLPPGGLLPDYARYGVLWMSRETLAAAMDMTGAFNSLVVRVQPGYPVASVIGALDRLLARYGSTGAYGREDQVSHRMLDDELVQLRTMATVFPMVFMVVAMFLLNVVVQRLINTQRDIVGVLKAFGYSNRQLGWHYSQLVLVIAFIGLVLGIASGIWLGRAMGELYMQYYRFPLLLFRLDAGSLLLVSALTLLVAWLGGWHSIRRAARLPPAEAMRPPAPARFHITRVERWLTLSRFSQPSTMIVRQLFRSPLRTALSVGGIAMATAVVVVGNFQFDSVSLMVHTQFARVQQQDAAVTFVDPVNRSVLYTLTRQPGIRYAEGRRVVTVRLVNGYRRWRTQLTGIPQPAHLQFVIDRNLAAAAIPREGILLTDFLADALSISPGERLQVEILEGERRRLELPVAGVTSEFLGVGAYMQLPTLNRVLGEGPLINQALLNLETAQSGTAYRILRDMPGVLGVTLRQTMLDSFYQTLARTFLTFTLFISILGGVMAFGVVYNTVRISLAEKGRELASLRVLGYTHGEVAHILLGEVAVLVLLAIPLGWLAGYGLAQALVMALPTEMYRVPLTLTTQTLAIAASVVVVSALASGLLAWYRLRRLDLVSVLKTRE